MNQLKTVSVKEIDIPLKAPFKTALRTVTTATSLIVTLTDEAGVSGIGEAPPTLPITGESVASIKYAIETVIGPKIVGQPVTLAGLAKIIDGALLHNSSAKAACNIAVYDLFCREHQLVLGDLLGGFRQQIKTDYTVSVDTPTKMATDAKQLVQAGFETLKIKVGDQTAALDFERVRQIRAAVGPDIKLRLDANQGWQAKTAIAMIRRFETAGFDIQLVEQPVLAPDFAGMAQVTAAVDTPIMADESIFTLGDAARLLGMHGCDILNIKLMKAGGITNAVKLAALAESYGIPCMVGSMIESQVAVTAAAHFAAATPNVKYVDLDAAMMFSEQPFVGGIQYQQNQITLNTTPGLGIAWKA